MKILLIDDNRTPVLVENKYGLLGADWTLAINFNEGLEALKHQGPFDLLCLDHDLASWDENGNEMTGYSIMLFLEANPSLMPKDILFVSGNPIGVKKMQACLDSILKKAK